jgi:hypothetical protein
LISEQVNVLGFKLAFNILGVIVLDVPLAVPCVVDEGVSILNEMKQS